MCAGGCYVFRTSKPLSWTLCYLSRRFGFWNLYFAPRAGKEKSQEQMNWKLDILFRFQWNVHLHWQRFQRRTPNTKVKVVSHADNKRSSKQYHYEPHLGAPIHFIFLVRVELSLLLPCCTGSDSRLFLSVVIAIVISSMKRPSMSFNTNLGISFRFWQVRMWVYKR